MNFGKSYDSLQIGWTLHRSADHLLNDINFSTVA